jgi:hypothetical protein
VREDIEVGDRVRVRSEGGSTAAGRYAGKQGETTMIARGFDGTVVDVRIEGNSFDTVFEEWDLNTTERKR